MDQTLTYWTLSGQYSHADSPLPGAHNPEQVSLFLDKLFPRKIIVPRGQFLHLIVV